MPGPISSPGGLSTAQVQALIDSAIRFEGYATIPTANGTTTLTSASKWAEFFTGTGSETAVLPVTSTLYLGFQFLVVNNSTVGVTVNSSGGDQVVAFNSGDVYLLTCIAILGTGSASWDAKQISGFLNATAIGEQITAAILAAQFPSPSVRGTAIFDGRGSVSGLTMTGIITAVDFNSNGKFDVTITDVGGNYLAFAQVYDNGDIGGATFPPTASIPNDSFTASGFQVQVAAGGTLLALPTLDSSVVARRVQVTVIK